MGFLFVGALVLVLGALILGCVSMIKGNSANSNYYMRLRILFQGISIGLLVVIALLG